MARRPRSEDGTLDSGGDVAVTAPPRGDLYDETCPTRHLLDRVGTKWVSLIVITLDAADGEVRFAELRRRIPGISQKMLSQTLSGLVADGLVQRRVEPTVPPAVHYRLSALGNSLTVPLAGLRAWAEEHMYEIDVHRQRR